MRRIVPFFLLGFLLLGFLSSTIVGASNLDKVNSHDKPLTQQKLQVLSTIKPIQALVLAIAGEHVESTQLIPDFASPHHYNFKPSDISRIKQADVIFRIDENFESLLNHAFENKSPNTPIISLADNQQLHLLKRVGKHRHGTKDKQHAKHNDKKSEHEHTTNVRDDHQQMDLHIWTSPQNMQILARAITTTLSKLDIKNKPFYEKNLTQFNAELMTLSNEIKAKFLPLKSKPYVVFHNSWQYFSHQFDLEKPVIVDFHEGVSAGTKGIRNIRKMIRAANIQCVLADPSIKPARVKTITEGLQINTGYIDILGAELALNKNTAVSLLKKVSATIADCLR